MLELFVDTGSTHTWIRRGKLTKLGVKSMGRRGFRCIDNRVVERDVARWLLSA